MPTYSDEDGLLDAASGSEQPRTPPPSHRGPDLGSNPPEYAAEQPYATGAYPAEPYGGGYSSEAYNSTDILPAPGAGGRKARREAAAAATAARPDPDVPFDQYSDPPAVPLATPPPTPGVPYPDQPFDQYAGTPSSHDTAPIPRVEPMAAPPPAEVDPVPEMGAVTTGLVAAGVAAAELREPTVAPPPDGGGYADGASHPDGAAPDEAGVGGGDGGDGGGRRVRDWTPTPLGRAVVPLALALVSVVALWAAWNHLNSGDDVTASPTPSVSVPQGDPGASATRTPAASSSPSPSASGSPSPSASAVSSGSASPSASVTASPSASSPPAVLVDRTVPVVVLNATSRTGLAAKVAAQLRAKGWRVTSVGNWRGGGVPTTTIYIDGHARAVLTMQGDLGMKAPWEKAPLAGMPSRHLVLVVSSDYPR